jgi:hypothetical protein
VHFQPAGGAQLDPSRRGGWEVEIDQDLEVTWVDQAAMTLALREQLPEGPPPPDLDAQLDAIRQIGANLIQAQDLFAQAAQQRLAGDETAATATEDEAAGPSRRSWRAAHSNWTCAWRRMLQSPAGSRSRCWCAGTTSRTIAAGTRSSAL